MSLVVNSRQGERIISVDVDTALLIATCKGTAVSNNFLARLMK